MYRAYTYCKLFGTSLSEYETRPYKETVWMLEIDKVYNQAVHEVEGR